mgnify:CR=1 FL=1
MDRLAATIVQRSDCIHLPFAFSIQRPDMSASQTLPPLFDEFPSVTTEEWASKIRDDLGRSEIDGFLRWDSIDGLSLRGDLRREDLDEIPHVSDDTKRSPLADTSEAPANAWDVRQNLTHPDPAEANRQARSAVRRGATSLGLVHASAQPAGAFGLQIETLDDLRTVLNEIPLDTTSFHLDTGPAAPILLAALQQIAAERDGESPLTGSVGYDPAAALATGVLRNTDAAYALAGDLVSAAPSSFRSLTIDLRPYHNAGASAVLELAFGLGALSETLATLLGRGHNLSALLPRLQFVAAVSTSYFVEIAKLRALRLLVPQVVAAYASEANETIDYSPADLFVQAETSRRTETVYDPYVNMLRGTTEGMAAVIGGSDVLSVRPFDASLRPEDNFSARIARNVQLILREEAHLDVVADPGAGAYYLEAATDQLAQRAWEAFQELEADGGLIDGLQTGDVQEQIAEVRAEREREVATRERVLVGTNHYPALDETRLDDLEEPSPSPETDPVTLASPSLGRMRNALANGRPVSALLSGLAEGDTSIEALPAARVATDIEDVRLRTERHAKETGHTPTVLLAPLGPAKMRSARANFARNVFGVAGFNVVAPLRFETPDEAAEAAADEDADVVVLCSADREYPELTPALRRALNDRDASPLLIVAGSPEKIDTDLPADDFIHLGNLLRDKLEEIQSRLGIEINSSDD